MKEYYSLLGVLPTATADEIGEAYENKKRELSPNRFQQGTPEWQLASAALKELDNAYDQAIMATFAPIQAFAAPLSPLPRPRAPGKSTEPLGTQPSTQPMQPFQPSIKPPIKPSVQSPVQSSFQPSLQSSFEFSMGSPIESSIGSPIGSSIENSMKSSIESSIESSMGSSIGSSMDLSMQAGARVAAPVSVATPYGSVYPQEETVQSSYQPPYRQPSYRSSYRPSPQAPSSVESEFRGLVEEVPVSFSDAQLLEMNIQDLRENAPKKESSFFTLGIEDKLLRFYVKTYLAFSFFDLLMRLLLGMEWVGMSSVFSHYSVPLGEALKATPSPPFFMSVLASFISMLYLFCCSLPMPIVTRFFIMGQPPENGVTRWILVLLSVGTALALYSLTGFLFHFLPADWAGSGTSLIFIAPTLCLVTVRYEGD
jgi:hypothetical protein